MFENAHIQVVEQTLAPSVRVSPALPGPSLIVALSPATLWVNGADPIQLGRAAVYWAEDGIASLESAGDADARLLLAHVKLRVSPPAPIPPDDGTIRHPEVYNLIFENDRVRVMWVVGGNGSQTTMHSHPGRGFRYFVTDVRSRRSTADGKYHDAASEPATSSGASTRAATATRVWPSTRHRSS
jgi:hypothetical protein